MPVPEQIPHITYTTDGRTTDFPLTFDCPDQAHLIVSLDDVEVEIGQWALSNSNVVFNSPPTSNSVLSIERSTPLKRTRNYETNNNSFRPGPLNRDFDSIWRKLQELGYRDSVLLAKLVQEINTRIRDDKSLNSKVFAIDTRVTQNELDIDILSNRLAKEILQRTQADIKLKSFIYGMLDEAINEGTVNALAVIHVDSVDELNYVQAWEGRIVNVHDIGLYRYTSSIRTWNTVSTLYKQNPNADYFIYQQNIDNTQALNTLLETSKSIVIPDLGYDLILSDNISVLANTTVEIQANVIQKTSNIQKYDGSAITSKYPLFKLTDSGIIIKTTGNGKLNSYYEAVQCIGSLDSNNKPSISNITIDVNAVCINADIDTLGYGGFAGIAVYAVSNLDLKSSSVEGYLKQPTWDSTKNQSVYPSTGMGGFTIYICSTVEGQIYAGRNGANGIFLFACSDHRLKLKSEYNGMSGLQIGPADVTYVKVGGYINAECNNNFADACDIRWTGSGRVSMNNLIIQTTAWDNGFFNNDKTKPTQDGSGIATLAYIQDVVVIPSTSKRSAGSGLYIQGSDNIKVLRSVSDVYTNKEGLYIGESCSNIDVDYDVTTNGTALSFGGSQTLTSVEVKGKYTSTNRGIIVANTSNYNNVHVDASITSQQGIDIYLDGAVNFENSKFLGTANYYMTANTGNMRGTKSNLIGSMIATGLNSLDLSSIDYTSTSTNNALVLTACSNVALSGSIKADSGTALTLFSAGNSFTNRVYMRALTCTSSSGDAVLSNYSTEIYDLGGTVFNGNQVWNGYGLSTVDASYKITTDWLIGTVKANSTVTTNINNYGLKVGSRVSVSYSQSTGNCLLKGEVNTSGVLTLYCINPTSSDVVVNTGKFTASISY